MSAYGGHFESICYHPLLLFDREDDYWPPSYYRSLSPRGRVGKLLLPEIEQQLV